MIGALTVFLVFGVMAGSLGSALPVLRVQYHLGQTDGGAAVGAYNLGALLAIIVSGVVERVVPARKATIALIAIFAIGAISASAAVTFPLFVACTGVAGFGFGGLIVYLNSAFANEFGERSLLMVSVLNAAYSAGAVLGPIAVSATAHTDIRAVMWIIAVSAVLGIPASGCVSAESARATDTEFRPAVRKVLAVVAPFAVLAFLYSGLETATGAWESTQLVWTGMSSAAAAQLTSLFFVGLAVGRAIIPLFARQAAPQRTVQVGFGAGAAALLLSTQPFAQVCGYFLAGLAIAPILPAILTWTSSVVPASRLATACVLTGSLGGATILPTTMGALVTPGSPWLIAAALGTVAGLGVLAAYVIAVFRSAAKPKSKEQND